MKIQKISPSDIIMDKPDAEYRTFSKEFCVNLGKSIETDGLLQEPCVREIPDRPGKYRPVYGRNRIYTCAKILKWDLIPCKVAPASLSDEEAVAMEDAENIWRHAQSGAQLRKSLARWMRAYEARNPNVSGSGAHQKRASIVRERIAETEASGVEVTEEVKKEIVEKVEVETKPFSKVLAETLKISASAAARLARQAKNLDADQIDILEKQKVTDYIVDQIAALGDRELIVRAIKLIASGMDHAEAVRQAGKPRREAKDRAKEAEPGVQSEPRPPKEPARRKEKDLTDDEWLEEYCGHLLKQLKGKRVGPFKRDAILYRRLAETIVRFRTSCKKPLAELKGDTGMFYRDILRVNKTSHPRDWNVCGGCEGRGSTQAEEGETGQGIKDGRKKCGRCNGAGFVTKMEI